ncbi:hypothetical protein [Demequina sp.]|uniref:hypothetical protein n=1 Tax=Demequina sp. TaxID=2050685 RepID=UPI0025C26491|nr:hypothetical protein [Demequina sp.]
MARGFHPAPGASAEVREAMNPDLSKAELLPLGGSRTVAVRAIVAARLDCPLGLMVTLAHDYHPDVRCAIASNPSAQRSVLAYLAADRHVEVVRAVVDNPSLPPDLLDELSFHKKSPIREAAAQRLNAVTAQERLDSSEQRLAEDARVPEMAEHVWPGSLASLEVDALRGPSAVDAEEPAGPSSQQAGDEPEVADDAQAAPRWTRTAPVRGFRLPR